MGSTAEGDHPGCTPSLADINRSSRDTNALQLWARQTDGSGMARRGEESRRRRRRRARKVKKKKILTRLPSGRQRLSVLYMGYINAAW